MVLLQINKKCIWNIIGQKFLEDECSAGYLWYHLKDDKVLVAQRSETMCLPLKWEFPDGKVMEGESEEECLKRELHEELNISIAIREKLSSSVFDYGDFTIALIPFLVEHLECEVILHEHCRMGWFTSQELTALDLALADMPILEEFLMITSQQSCKNP